MKPISERRAYVWQFLKFNLVGVMNTLIDILVFALLLLLGVPYMVAQCISYGCGTANSYLMNSRWTFGQTNRSGRWQIVRFMVVNVTVLGASLVLLYVILSGWHIPEIMAKLIVTVITMAMNFLGSRLWVFKAN